MRKLKILDNLTAPLPQHQGAHSGWPARRGFPAHRGVSFKPPRHQQVPHPRGTEPSGSRGASTHKAAQGRVPSQALDVGDERTV